jgi:NAD-dependent DNA ligase
MDKEEVITTVKKVLYIPKLDGTMLPRVEIEPVNFLGVTISCVTGFYLRFIEQYNICQGTKLKIRRASGVIPYIHEVIKEEKKEKTCELNFNITNEETIYI